MEKIEIPQIIEKKENLDEIQEFSKDFFDRYYKSGFKLSVDNSLHVEDGSSLLLSNSTMCRYRDYIKDKKLPSEGVAARQLCIRTQDLSRYYNNNYKFNFPSLFNMVGLILPKDFKDKVFKETYDWLLSTGIEAERIYVKTSKGATLVNSCIPLDQIKNVLYDTEKESFYKWKYGMEDVFGEGLTFSLLQNDGRILDIGNIIAFTDKKTNLLAWETAFGIETLTARRDNVDLYKKHKIFQIFGEITNEQQKPLLDSISSTIELIVQGFEPGPKMQAYVLRKYLNIISKLSERLGIDIDPLIIKYCNFKDYDTAVVLNKIKIYIESLKKQKEINLDNFVKYIRKNNDFSRDKKIEIAKSTFSLDEEDILELL